MEKCSQDIWIIVTTANITVGPTTTGILVGSWARKLSVTANKLLDQECLKDLRVTNPHDDKDRIEGDKGGLLKDSYRWILGHDDFKQWQNDPESQLLWIKGDPGKGKTMLLCGIINELAASTADDTTTISFFFCQAAIPDINNATAALRGLLCLILDKQPALITHLQKAYDKAGKQLFGGVNAWYAISRIFTDILKDSLLQSTYLIIDGLDECTHDLPLLLDLVYNLPSLPSLDPSGLSLLWA